MRDGYYLSTYMHINELAYLMGVKKRHDQNISLWLKHGNKINLVHYWEIERLTGYKQHATSFFDIKHATNFINELLSEYKLSLDDMVEVWGTPQIQTCNDYHSINDYPELSYHSISHLFSAVMMDTEKYYNSNIIALAVDGGPDSVLDTEETKKYYYSGCIVRNGKSELFQIFSPGPLWFYASLCYNLREGTLMALASASKSELLMPVSDVLLVKDISSLKNIFDYIKNLVKYVDALDENQQGKLFNEFDPLFTVEENKISMVVKVIQSISLKIMERNIEDILQKYDLNPFDTYLALSGGYALNCPTNSYLMHKYGFKGFIAPPCVSDCGLSLGIALYAFNKKMNTVEFNLRHSYYGNQDNNLDYIINCSDFNGHIKQVSDLDEEQAVEDIICSPIVWFDGRAEIGPRALGNRSIIGDPRNQATKEKLNIYKQRQWWRPVAPIILEEEIDNWFENAYVSPFMLHTFTTKRGKEDLIPAITHLDGSARVQTIDRVNNKKLYSIVNKFKEKTGVPIVCNTSLNDRGEPIIDKIGEAINFALRKGIRIVYVNGKRLEICNHEKYLEEKPLKRSKEFTVLSEEERAVLLKEFNPHDVPEDILQVFFQANLEKEYNLKNIDDARKLTIYAKYLLKNQGISIC